MTKSFSSLGPGLLFAGASIGVSHLVQSTRAGAEFGFGLLWPLVLVYFFKYPFFQYGPRYASATGETLLDGYKKLGKSVLISYFILNFINMFTIQTAVTVVTAGLASHLFKLPADLVTWSGIISLLSLAILLIGKYRVLDNIMKYIVVILALSTIFTVLIGIFNTTKSFTFNQIIPSGTAEIAFLIAFMGWMPAPLDISIWHSLWSVEKNKSSYKKINYKQAIFDFNVGYIGILFLGVCFVILGAVVMFKSGQSFSSKGTVFAYQLISLYTKNLGNYAHIFIGITALSTMFSTSLTTLDASPRAMDKTLQLLFNKKSKFLYPLWLLILTLGTYIILKYFLSDMGVLVKIATILSFLTAPFYAVLNFVLITGRHTPKEHRPGKGLKILSWAGIAFLVFFSIWYLLSI
ncbi:MAG: NRAMP family divalent metal transporter [Tenacibaculum sp.]